MWKPPHRSGFHIWQILTRKIAFFATIKVLYTRRFGIADMRRYGAKIRRVIYRYRGFIKEGPRRRRTTWFSIYRRIFALEQLYFVVIPGRRSPWYTTNMSSNQDHTFAWASSSECFDFIRSEIVEAIASARSKRSRPNSEVGSTMVVSSSS